MVTRSLKNTPQSHHCAPQELKESEDRQGTSLEKFITDEVRCLTEILSQIENDIQRRRDLSSCVTHQIDERYRQVKSDLLLLAVWKYGASLSSASLSTEARRVALEKQLDMLLAEKRREEIQCWQDIEQLRKERRTWFKQYKDLLQRAKPWSAQGKSRRKVRL